MNLQEYKKPDLIILEEQPKLRTLPFDQKLGIAKQLVTNLLNDLGVGKNADTDHHVRTIKFIAESMVNYSAGEIEKAFQLFIAGEFRERPFQQLNSVIVGKVMQEFENYKRNKLKIYRQMKKLSSEEPDVPTDAEKERMNLDALDRAEKEFKEKGKFSKTEYHIYDFLDKSGRASWSKEEKWRAMDKAKKIRRSNEMTKASQSLEMHRALKKTLEIIESNQDNLTKNLAKTILLEIYFTKKQMRL